MASWVDIANLAGKGLGARRIASLSDASKLAQDFSALRATIRDEVLAAHPWNPIITRANLAADPTPPVFGFAFRYALPTAPYCLRVWQLGRKFHFDPDRTKFSIEGRWLLTDESAPLAIIYLQQLDDPTGYSPMLVTTLAKRFEAALAFGLTNSSDREKTAMAAFEELLADARSIDAMEGNGGDIEESEILQARY